MLTITTFISLFHWPVHQYKLKSCSRQLLQSEERSERSRELPNGLNPIIDQNLQHHFLGTDVVLTSIFKNIGADVLDIRIVLLRFRYFSVFTTTT